MHTLVNAKGKKSKTTLDSPLCSLRVTSLSPSAVLVLSVKSGAIAPISKVILSLG